MGLKNRARNMYRCKETGTYQTRDTSDIRNAQSPAPVVHEEVTPPAAPIFDPLPNHQGAPVQNPVTTVPSTSVGGHQRYDDDDHDTYFTEEDEKALDAVIGCGVLVVATVALSVLAAIGMGIYYWLF